MKFAGFLALIFITLKLIGLITWSWWLVLLPLYAGVLVVSLIALVPLLMWCIGSLGVFFVELLGKK